MLGGQLLPWPRGEVTLAHSSILVTQELNLLTHMETVPFHVISATLL